MRLSPLDSPELFRLVAGWLAEPENWKWLDFGPGVQALTPVNLKIMVQREIQVLRLYTADDDDQPIGVVGLANVDRNFKTASVWCVLGDKRYGGYATRAVREMLSYGFDELGLHTVSAWTADTNAPARRLLDKLHFNYIGRLRQCHSIDGHAVDRLLFDILATEHREFSHAGGSHTRVSAHTALRGAVESAGA